MAPPIVLYMIRLAVWAGILSITVVVAWFTLTKFSTFKDKPYDGLIRPDPIVTSSVMQLLDRPTKTSKPTSSRPPACTPQKNIVLLKVHKCASSAFQNILLRYGDLHNLTFVLPNHDNYLGHIRKFSASLALPLPSRYGNEYNILCHHTRWHQENIEQIMPNNTVYITGLKEPVSMFESAYDFFNLKRRYGVNLTEYMDDPHSFFYNDQYNQSRFARNPMMFDFGLEVIDFAHTEKIKSKISEIERRFSLVMLADEMDESLVLLRKLLCWTWNDVVTFKVNKRKEGRAALLTKETRKKILAWNHADGMLYEHFYKLFQEKKRLYGRDELQSDVAKLRQVTQLWSELCDKVQLEEPCNLALKSKESAMESLFPTGSPLSEVHRSDQDYELTKSRITEICCRLSSKELKFTSYLRDTLWPTPTKMPYEMPTQNYDT